MKKLFLFILFLLVSCKGTIDTNSTITIVDPTPTTPTPTQSTTDTDTDRPTNNLQSIQSTTIVDTSCRGNYDLSVFNPWTDDNNFSLDFTGGVLDQEIQGLTLNVVLTDHGLQRIRDYHRDSTGLIVGNTYQCEYSYKIVEYLQPFVDPVSNLKTGFFYLQSINIDEPLYNICLELMNTQSGWGYNYNEYHQYSISGSTLTLKLFGGDEFYGHPTFDIYLDCSK